MFTWKKKQLLGVAILAVAIGATAGYTNWAQTNKPHVVTVQFDRGTTLESGAENQIGKAATILFTNDDYQAKVVGHTGTQGDSDANMALSEKRAEKIKQMLISENVKAGRIETHGAGGSQPLTQKEDESNRTYQGRLSRATIHIQR